MTRKIRARIASGYSDAGASHEKNALRAFNARSGSAFEDIDFNNATLRQRGRMLYMASPIAAAAINTNCTKIVGKGLRMKCNINADLLGLSPEAAKEWCKRTEAEFRFWCEERRNCDALGLNNFAELQHLAVKSWLMSGDVFVLLKREKATKMQPYSLRLQIIEADRVCTPYSCSGGLFSFTEGINGKNPIHDGVEVDESGRVVAYHICSDYPGFIPFNQKPEWTRVKAVGELAGIPNVLQIMDPERPDQYRGVTSLASVMEVLLQNRRHIEATLTAAIIQTYFTMVVKKKDDLTNAMSFAGQGEINDKSENEDEDDYIDAPKYEMEPEACITIGDDEDVTFGNPNIPTAGFEEFNKTIVKQVGAALEIPYDVLIKEFDSSYSAAKGALEEAWEVFKKRRSWFVNDFCQPIYEAWLAEAIALGRISAPGFFNDPLIRASWCGARWDGPAQTHLDPVKEAIANMREVEHGWKTNEQITREFYGVDWEENMQALKNEMQLIAEIMPQQNSSTAGRSGNSNAGNK